MKPITAKFGALTIGVVLVAWAAAAGAQEPPASTGDDAPKKAPRATTPDKPEKPNAADAKPQPLQPLDTTPPDSGFGQHVLSEKEQFPDETAFAARVDRRGALDATSDRAILWPTAYTPEQNSVVVSNYYLYGNQISYSPTDDLQLSTTAFIPTNRVDFSISLSGKQTMWEGYQGTVAIQPFLHYRDGSAELDTRSFGGGLGLTGDFYLGDDVVLGAFVYGFGTMYYGYDQFDYSNCESRSDYISGACTDKTTQGRAFPKGGHWIAGGLSLTYYLFDWLSLRLEAFSGAVAGSFLGTEYIYGFEDISAKRARYEDPTIAGGIPFDGAVTVGGGLEWSNGLFGIQLAGYAYDAVSPTTTFRQLLFTPMLNGSVKF